MSNISNESGNGDHHFDATENWNTLNQTDDLEGLCRINLRYLKGELDESPYEPGPLEFKHLDMNKVFKVAEWNLIVDDVTPFDQPAPSEGRICWEQTHYRSGASFLMPLMHAHRMFEKLKSHGDIFVRACKVASSSRQGLTGSDSNVWLCRFRNAPTKEDLEAKEWTFLNGLKEGINADYDALKDDYYQLSAIQKEEPVHFEIVSKAENEEVDLFHIIAEAAEALALPRVRAEI